MKSKLWRKGALIAMVGVLVSMFRVGQTVGSDMALASSVAGSSAMPVVAILDTLGTTSPTAQFTQAGGLTILRSQQIGPQFTLREWVVLTEIGAFVTSWNRPLAVEIHPSVMGQPDPLAILASFTLSNDDDYFVTSYESVELNFTLAPGSYFALFTPLDDSYFGAQMQHGVSSTGDFVRPFGSVVLGAVNANTGTAHNFGGSPLPIGARIRGQALGSVPDDATPPVVQPQVTPVPNEGGWHKSDATISWNVTDPESELASEVDCDTSSQTTDTSGTVLTCTATNAAGLWASRSVTIKRDTVSPVVAFAGNAGAYLVDQDVDITCMSSDERSGLATPSDCGRTSGPAYAVGLGAHTITATAADNADNETVASTTFTVDVTYASLCSLTRRFIDADGIRRSLCMKLDTASLVEAPVARVEATEAYKREVRALSGVMLTSAEAEVLLEMANGLWP